MDKKCDSSDSDEFLEPSLGIDTKSVQHYLPTDTPANGHEYLFNVINEAKKCPKTVVANIHRDQFSRDQSVYCLAESLPKVSSEFLPTESWKIKQIEHFNTVRDAVSKIRPMLMKPPMDMETMSDCDWWNYVYSEEGRVIRLPLVSAVCCLDQVSIVRLVELHTEWLEKRRLELRVDVASWVFALLTCLEIPLDPDTCDSLRSLARYSWNRRATIAQTVGSCADGVLLQSLNLIICLISLFFGQADLAD